MIPRVFHQIWIGPERLSDRHRRFMDSWRELHPGWAFRLWTNETLPELPNLQFQFDRAQSWAGKADIARYEILLAEGGVYIDVDLMCLKPIDPLLVDCEAFVPLSCCGATNTIFGGTPGHPMLREIVDEAPKYFNPADPVQSGPILFQRLRHRTDVRWIEDHLLLRGFPTKQAAYAWHAYELSWRRR